MKLRQPYWTFIYPCGHHNNLHLLFLRPHFDCFFNSINENKKKLNRNEMFVYNQHKLSLIMKFLRQ